MAVLTVSSYFQKGSPVLISVSKPELLELIDSDYFEDMEHWNKIILKYKSPTGQFERIVCDGQDAIPSAFFQISTKADDLFQINQIIIMDFDGKIYVIDRSILAEVIALDINYAQEEEVDYTFFAKTGSYGAYMDISSDEKTIVVQNNYVSIYNQKHYYNAVVNDITAEINEALTAFVNYYHVDSYYFDNELTYVYIAGRLGESFRGKELPALPNQENNLNFNVTRIVKVDIATKEVTHLGDLPLRTNGSGEDTAYNMIADSISDEIGRAHV
jgi:hypothetical protein